MLHFTSEHRAVWPQQGGGLPCGGQAVAAGKGQLEEGVGGWAPAPFTVEQTGLLHI